MGNRRVYAGAGSLNHKLVPQSLARKTPSSPRRREDAKEHKDLLGDSLSLGGFVVSFVSRAPKNLLIALADVVGLGEENQMNPQRPRHISPFAEKCLLALASEGLGTKLSLGGAFGLAYYLEYRETHDVDAWWDASAGEQERRRIVRCLEETLSSFGQIRTRSWGDVVSVELVKDGKAVFGFQIARRAEQLEASQIAPWPPHFLLDSFRDLVAAKMVALVERGAPRDFRDVHALCDAGLADPELCWSLWGERQRLTGDDVSSSRAELAILTHLGRIELHRPVANISDPAQRAKAEQVRAWFRKEFLSGLLD